MAVPRPDNFVAAVARALNAATPTDLARAIKLPGYNAPQRVRRWMEGDNAPDYEGVMLMLEATGWFRLRNTSDGASPIQAPGLDADALAAALEELVALQEREDAVLEQLLARAAAQVQPRSDRTANG